MGPLSFILSEEAFVHTIRITFKTPDAVDGAVDNLLEFTGGLDEDEREALREESKEALQKWIRYGELITIEFDLKAGTAKVVRADV